MQDLSPYLHHGNPSSASKLLNNSERLRNGAARQVTGYDLWSPRSIVLEAVEQIECSLVIWVLDDRSRLEVINFETQFHGCEQLVEREKKY